jgi:hypothetical protein
VGAAHPFVGHADAHPAIPRGRAAGDSSSMNKGIALSTSGIHRTSYITRRKPTKIESIAGIAAIDDPGPDTNEADLADWIEQHQTIPLPDDDLPPPRT